MPNWCSNVVTVESKSKAALTAIANAYNKGTLLTSLLKDSKETDPKLITAWRFNNWGTCLDVAPPDNDDAQVYKFKSTEDFWSLDLNFESAWTPPLKLYALLSIADEISLTAFFYESVTGYCGRFKNGIDAFYTIDKLTSKWTSLNLPTDIDCALGITERLEEWEDYEFECKEEEKEKKKTAGALFGKGRV